MTHTLHRQGSLEDLRKDFVVFSMACQSVNAKGSVPKIQKVFEIIEKYNPINFGDVKTGNIFKATKEAMKENLKENSYIHFVFTDRETVGKVLRDLKDADIGLSVVVSGVVNEIDQLCKQAGLKMHTVEFSGGIYGKTERLPEGPILEITTMCGHGLIASNLVRYLVEQVRKGKKKVEEAAVELAKQCQCGVFNPKRAEQLLLRLI
ncbi:MAG: hypothetical protein A2V86_06860 [Deltaproteobacteria bacterium RBG_16_49_23]|nr:MAG: hypothetical protein A2V86_06860 [Deltaproteobacteria bacterium RBG_16_49_23]